MAKNETNASPQDFASSATSADEQHVQSIAEILHSEVTAWIVLAVSLILTVLAWYVSNAYVHTRAFDRFEFEVEEAQIAIVKRMQEYEQVLRGGVGLFNTDNLVTRKKWRTYVDTLEIERNWPGIQGVGFSKWLKPSEKEVVIAQVRAEGYPDFDIKPAGPRDIYTTILYLEPLSGRNLRAFGFDMFSEPTRRAAMAHARDSGEATVSGRVTLVQETSKAVQAGFLMYLPVYRESAPLATMEERRAALLGFVYSPFRVNDLLAGILPHGTANLHFNIYDGEQIIPDNLLFDNESEKEGGGSSIGLFSATRQIQLPHRNWTASFTSTPQFDAEMNSAQPQIIAVAGIAVDLLLFAIIWALSRQKRRVQVLTDSWKTEMQRSQSRLASVIESLPGSMFVIGADGMIQMANARVKSMLGYEPDELLGKKIETIVPQRYRGSHERHTEQFMSSPAERKMGAGRELYAQHKDGNEVPVDIQLNTVVADTETYVLALVVDITEHRNIKLQIAAERSYLRSVLDSLSDGVEICDEAGKIVYVNAALKKLYGIPESANTNEHWSDFGSLFLPDGKTPVPADQLPLYRAAQGTDLPPLELSVVPSGHPTRSVVVRASPVILENGTRKGAVAVVHDITDRKRAEIELRDAKNDAERANRAKTQFLSNMSHELRTPLNSILGFAQLLVLDDELDEQLRSSVGKIQAAGEHLLNLISDALDMSRIESGNLRVDPKPTHALSVVRECAVLVHPIANKYGIRLSIDEGIAPYYEINVDPTRFKQVLLNLVSNAAKYNHRGGSIWIRCDAAPNDRIRFSVKDNGEGISEELQRQVFQPFNRLGHERGQVEGTGIGLVISKGLVELMGGTISFRSKRGEGSEFTVEFPARVGATYVDSQSIAASPQVTQLETANCSFDCLYIEDNQANIELVDALLKGYWPNARLITAASAELGLELAAVHQPHLVLLDIFLPGMDGYLALAQLRAMAELKETPVIALSASASETDIRRGTNAGFAAYLTKPIHVPTMLATMENVLVALMRKGKIKDRSESRRAGNYATVSAAENQNTSRVSGSSAAVTENSAKADLPALDPAMTAQLTSYLGRRAVPFIDALLVDLPRLIESMEQAAAESNFDAVRRDAHTIRGNTSNVGATALVNLCAQISMESKAGRLAEVKQLVTELRAEYEQRVLPAIQVLRQQLSLQAGAM